MWRLVNTCCLQCASIPLSLFRYIFFVIFPLFSAEMIIIASKFTTFPDTILYRRHSSLQYASRPAQPPPSSSQQLAKIGLWKIPQTHQKCKLKCQDFYQGRYLLKRLSAISSETILPGRKQYPKLGWFSKFLIQPGSVIFLITENFWFIPFDCANLKASFVAKPLSVRNSLTYNFRSLDTNTVLDP